MNNLCEKFTRAVIYLLMLIVGESTSLKNLKITVPERVRVGDSALLTCNYDLEDANLYAIKWYLGDEEFYQYVPKNKPPHQTFQVRNIEVNISSSNMQDVTLVNVQSNHTGHYKCEVSEDIPRYDTKYQGADILVVDVPETEPKIVVDRKHLSAGEKLHANCSSGFSHPAPNITWTINGLPLNNSYRNFIITKPSTSNKYSKRTTNSTLTLDTNGLFQDGRLLLKCFSEILSVYKSSASIEITEDRPYLASITGDASPHSHQSAGCSQLILKSVWPHGLSVIILSLLDLLLGIMSKR